MSGGESCLLLYFILNTSGPLQIRSLPASNLGKKCPLPQNGAELNSYPLLITKPDIPHSTSRVMQRTKDDFLFVFWFIWDSRANQFHCLVVVSNKPQKWASWEPAHSSSVFFWCHPCFWHSTAEVKSSLLCGWLVQTSLSPVL